MFIVAYSFMIKEYDNEKISVYECGFSAFEEDSRDLFDVRFYLVAILFLIFDLEILLLFPYCISIKSNGILGFTAILIFSIILLIGIIYEWFKGVLDW